MIDQMATKAASLINFNVAGFIKTSKTITSLEEKQKITK